MHQMLVISTQLNTQWIIHDIFLNRLLSNITNIHFFLCVSIIFLFLSFFLVFLCLYFILPHPLSLPLYPFVVDSSLSLNHISKLDSLDFSFSLCNIVFMFYFFFTKVILKLAMLVNWNIQIHFQYDCSKLLT